MNGPILVGVDGSTTALAAVRWASDEAQSRGLELELLYAGPELAGRMATGPGTPPMPTTPEQAHARAVLSVAQTEAGARASSVPIRTRMEPEAPVRALVRASEHATLLVLGLTGGGGVDEVLLGSTALAASGQAHCPVVGVRGWPLTGADRPYIAVGVSTSEADAAALAVAFERAHRHRRDLLVIHASQRRLPGRQDGDGERRIAEALRSWRARYPAVAVNIETTNGSPSAALLRRTDRLAEIVTGTRRRGAGARALLGSTSQSVLRRSPVPVIVVNPNFVAEPNPEATGPYAESTRDPHAPSEPR